MAVAYKKEIDFPLENFRKMFLDLKKGEYFGRLGKTFKTDKNFYFIDTGTGKIAQLEKHVYLVLKTLFESDNFDSLYELKMDEEKIIDALETIKQGVEQAHILSAPILETMTGEATTDLKNTLLTQTTSLVLELTEECNLRCKYCIYHPQHPAYRAFGKKSMNWSTAKQAIDFLYEHSRKHTDEKINIGFYGGEPLLNFEVLKLSIEYAKERFKGEEIHYSLTTNAVLLTKNISDYLVKNDVSITVSLDGPKELHDVNRIFPNEEGSFEGVKKGLENLVSSFGIFNKHPVFSINAVVSSDTEDVSKSYDLMYDFFETCDWIPKGIGILCSGVDQGPQKSTYILPQSEDERKLTKHMKDLISSWSDIKTKDYTEYEPNFSEHTVNMPLIRIHKRFISEKPSENYPMNGCCTPGRRKAYITVNGDILPCERVGTQIPTLGNVSVGYDVENIKKYYVDEYINQSKEYCKNCWAANLCGLCYNNCYEENGINMDYKNTLCVDERFQIEDNLIRYHKMLENSPEIIEKFNEIELI